MPSVPSAADLQRMERQLYDAMLGGDPQTLETLLSDRVQFIHSNGLVQSKQEVVDGCQAPRARTITTSGTTSQEYPGIGVVSTICHTTNSPGSSSESKSNMRVSYVWLEEPKGWRLVLRQALKLPV